MEKQKPSWLKTSQEEVEKIIIDLAKQEITTEKIGLILRDQYGIPTARVYGKKISQIIKQVGLEAKSALANVEKNVEELKKHIAKNKQDKKAKYTLIGKSANLIKKKKYKEKAEHKVATN